MNRRSVPLLPLAAVFFCAAVLALQPGCANLANFPVRAGSFGAPQGQGAGVASTAGQAASAFEGIRVVTKDRSTLRFADARWSLTLRGIEGRATVETGDGPEYDKDTTLSYWDVSSATSSGRSSTTRQFLLTILGVILVIGLAALVLYAAFPVNDR